MAVDIKFSFLGQNLAAQRAARVHAGALITAIDKETRRAIRLLIVRAIREGIAPVIAARQIEGMVGMNLRQAAAAASQRVELEASGLAPAHVDEIMERVIRKKIKYRAKMIARTECLPADTLVDAAVMRAASRRWYEGDLAEVRTRDGREFRATANHPMLTHRGWIAAGQVTEGDYLVCDRREDRAGALGDQNVAHPPSTLGEIFDAAAAVGPLERRVGSYPDFHGDGREVDAWIARPDRELRIGRFTPIFKENLDGVLSPAGLAAMPLCPNCGRLLPIYQRTGLAARAGPDALCPCHSDSDGIKAQPALVQLDRVVRVGTRQRWSGYVFNLSTTDGYYTINRGLYTGNTMMGLNRGLVLGWKQAQREGLLSKTAVKEWQVTPDDRLCEFCRGMEGEKTPVGKSFEGGVTIPAHPLCRCVPAISIDSKPTKGVAARRGRQRAQFRAERDRERRAVAEERAAKRAAGREKRQAAAKAKRERQAKARARVRAKRAAARRRKQKSQGS